MPSMTIHFRSTICLVYTWRRQNHYLRVSNSNDQFIVNDLTDIKLQNQMKWAKIHLVMQVLNGTNKEKKIHENWKLELKMYSIHSDLNFSQYLICPHLFPLFFLWNTFQKHISADVPRTDFFVNNDFISISNTNKRGLVFARIIFVLVFGKIKKNAK